MENEEKKKVKICTFSLCEKDETTEYESTVSKEEFVKEMMQYLESKITRKLFVIKQMIELKNINQKSGIYEIEKLVCEIINTCKSYQDILFQIRQSTEEKEKL